MAVPWKVYAGFCSAGLVSLVCHSIWRPLRPRPRGIVDRTSRILDLAADLGGRPIGDGRHQSMARLPLPYASRALSSALAPSLHTVLLLRSSFVSALPVQITAASGAKRSSNQHDRRHVWIQLMNLQASVEKAGESIPCQTLYVNA